MWQVDIPACFAICRRPSSRSSSRAAPGTSTTILCSVRAIELYRVPAAGGTPVLLATPSPPLQVGLRWPQFLPDGRRYLYQAASGQPTARAVWVKSLDSDETTQLLLAESHAAFAPPHFLLFTRQRTLVAQRLDVSTLKLVGEPSRIVDDVLVTANGRAAFGVSDAGVLAYRTGEAPRSLVWVDRSGKVSDPIGALSADRQIRLSPDGTRVAFHQPTRDGADDVYIYDIGQKVPSQLTKHPGTDHVPIWSPDGADVAYTRFRSTDQGIYQMRADGATPERVLVPIDPEDRANTFALDWGRQFVVFKQSHGSYSNSRGSLSANYFQAVGAPTIGRPNAVALSASSYVTLQRSHQTAVGSPTTPMTAELPIPPPGAGAVVQAVIR